MRTEDGAGSEEGRGYPGRFGIVVTQKMHVEFDEEAQPEKIMPKVLKACRKVEPDCEVEF